MSPKRLGIHFEHFENGLERSLKLHFGRVEIVSNLFLNTEIGEHHFYLDRLMDRYITNQEFLGEIFPVLSKEDIIVLKAILRRDSKLGKHDLDTIISQTLKKPQPPTGIY